METANRDAAVQATLEAIVTRDLEWDLNAAATFPGGYEPTERVLLQRHWSEQFDRLPALAGQVRADFWIEASLSVARIGFADNRDRVALDRDVQALAEVLRGAGFTCRVVSDLDGASGLCVKTSRKSDNLVSRATTMYLFTLALRAKS